MTPEILEKIGSYNKDFDKVKILKAFDFASEKHNDLKENKCCAMKVLDILLPLKPDEDMIIAILLHDLYVVSLISDDSVRDNFGQGVFSLLGALKKLYGLNYAENDKGAQVEVLRKMFLTLAKDLRVILIWLAHRLCALQHFANSPDVGNRVQIAKETMNVYVPIASRLGIYRIKTQLEDLSFQYLHPIEYERLSSQVKYFSESKKFPIE
ncbi:MAG: HD domain-containing protein, partial [Patescibacteria group bacterium]